MCGVARGHEYVRRDRLRDRHDPTRQRLRGRLGGWLRRSDRALANLPDQATQRPVYAHPHPWPGLEGRARCAVVRRSLADPPLLDRRSGVCRSAQRTLRPKRSPCVLRPVPASRAVRDVQMHRAASPSAMGNSPDEAIRCLPPTGHSVTSPPRGIRRRGMRADRAGRRG